MVGVAVGLDPGSMHCGWARWTETVGGRWRCESAVELTREACEDVLRVQVSDLNVVVCEGFWLRPGRGALMQAGKSFGEVEVIGVARALCRWAGVEFRTVTPADRDAARVRLRASGYRFVARGWGPHAADAEAVVVAGLRLPVSALE